MEKSMKMEELGFEPRASRMRSERSTTELHPRVHKLKKHW